MNNYKEYTFSFTGGGTLIAETLVVARAYQQINDWTAVRVFLLEGNLLNKVKQGSFKRVFSEIKKRLSLLTPVQLDLMVNGSFEEANAMVLLGLAKAYDFFNDFIVEVLRNKYFSFDKMLAESDYVSFFNAKSLFHAEMNNLSEETAKKARQVLFKMLMQMGLITQLKNGIILKPILSSITVQAIVQDNPSWLTTFLCSKDEVQFELLNVKNV